MNFCQKVIYMKNRKTALVICLLAAILLLAGCGAQSERTVTVTYVWGNQVLHEEQVSAGSAPSAPTVDPDGAVFEGWLDASGQYVEPEALTVESNTRYTAVIIPELTGHGAYLTTDSTGKALPDTVLTGEDLYNALLTLAAPGAEAYFPAMPSGNTPVEAGAMAVILQSFFPEADPSDFFSGTGPVTRAQFAQAIHTMLGRSDREVLTLAEDAVIPPDLYLEHPQLYALLEALVPHTLSQEGITWDELDLTTQADPGFLNLDGYLYYVNEDRKFLRDGKVGKLKFGADGRYTSGDRELDDMVAGILKTIIEDNPNADRMELLRAAYEHSHMDYTYLRRDPYGTGDHGWEIEDAKTMITKGKGNCYNFAAIFWALARGLGYEARAVAGTCTSSVQPHGWVIIEIDGADYFFDPEWQYAYRERGENDHDMFMIPMSKINYWKYKWRE